MTCHVSEVDYYTHRQQDCPVPAAWELTSVTNRDVVVLVCDKHRDIYAEDLKSMVWTVKRVSS